MDIASPAERSPPPWASTLRQTAIAVAISVTALAARWLLDPILTPYQLYIAPAVASPLVTYWCGAGAGWLTFVVTTVASIALFVVPHHEPGALVGPIVAGIISVAFCIVGILLIDALVRSRREAERQAASAVASEARARRRDAYLREFIDHTSAMMYVKDLDGKYVLVNNRFESLFPGVAEEARGGAGRPADGVPAHGRDVDESIIETGRSETFEETVPLADGSHTWVSCKFPIVDDDGRTIAVGGVSTDVTELHAARADLERKERVLRNLIEIQEQEKQLLCSEFHDGLIQYAVGAKMLLESLERTVLPAAEAGAIDDAIQALARGIEDGRRVIRGIRPAELDDLGLAAALGALVDDTEAAGITVDSAIDPTIDDLPPVFQVTVYRIVQEALSNVRRHAGGRHAGLRCGRQGDEITVEVRDDGVGLGPDRAPTGFGITGMQERARLLGGECTVSGKPGEGTTVRVRLPVPRVEDAPSMATG